jgi:hypothetical protein
LDTQRERERERLGFRLERMLCAGRVLAVSYPPNPPCPNGCHFWGSRFRHVNPYKLSSRWRSRASDPDSSSSSFAPSIDSDPTDKTAAGWLSLSLSLLGKHIIVVWNDWIIWLMMLVCWAFGFRFCIIEGPETVQDFVKMELQEIQDNIRSRRNKIFLHMEEVSGWVATLSLYENHSLCFYDCYQD